MLTFLVLLAGILQNPLPAILKGPLPLQSPILDRNILPERINLLLHFFSYPLYS